MPALGLAQARRRREKATHAPRTAKPTAQGEELPVGWAIAQPLLLFAGAVSPPLVLSAPVVPPAPLETVAPLAALLPLVPAPLVPVAPLVPAAPLEAALPASGGMVNVQ